MNFFLLRPVGISLADTQPDEKRHISATFFCMAALALAMLTPTLDAII
jgi:hypothetical protein